MEMEWKWKRKKETREVIVPAAVVERLMENRNVMESRWMAYILKGIADGHERCHMTSVSFCEFVLFVRLLLCFVFFHSTKTQLSHRCDPITRNR